MSDFSRGEGWWLASDGKWYPPEVLQTIAIEPQGGAKTEAPGRRTDQEAGIATRQRRIFVSYAREDIITVGEMVSDIEGVGYDVFFDQELSGGSQWWSVLLDQIRGCDVFVIAMSPESMTSRPCRLERNYAIELGKPVLPIAVAETPDHLVPPDLQQMQHVEFSSEERASLRRMVLALRHMPACPPMPSPMPDEPQVPISSLYELQVRIDSPELLGDADQWALLGELETLVRSGDAEESARMMLEALRHRTDLSPLGRRKVRELLKAVAPEPAPAPSTTPQATTGSRHRMLLTAVIALTILVIVLILVLLLT